METTTNREGNMTTQSTDTWDTTTQAGRDALAEAAREAMSYMTAAELEAWLGALLADWCDRRP